MTNPPEHSGGDCPLCNSKGSLSYFRASSSTAKPFAKCSVCNAQFGGSASKAA